jgi:mannitol/fructose-specific phosphotransferase system IIA component
MLKEADMKNKSKIVEMQMAEKMSSINNVETDFLDKLTERLNSNE